MELLEQAYEKALSENEDIIEKWKRCVSEYICVKERLDTFRSELSLKIMVPLGPKALMRGKLYHTNEILVHLGDGWFSKRSAHQALDICNRRIKNAQDKIKEFEQEKSWLINRKNIPKEMNIFADNAHQEIIEEYDEEKEREWRERHKLRVKEHRIQLAKERETEMNTQNNEDYWQRLEELEIQEELRREFENADHFLSSENFTTISNRTKNCVQNNENETNHLINSYCVKNDLYERNNSGTDIIKHDTDKISNVVLLERKSKLCENLPLNMKLNYDFIGAFDENNTTNENSVHLKKKLSNFNETEESNNNENDINDLILNSQETKPNLIEDLEKISNVELLNRESNLNDNIKINIEIGENTLETNSNNNNTLETIKNSFKVTNNLKEKLNESSTDTEHQIEAKNNILKDYKLKLIELRKEIDGAIIKTHAELCQQLDKYDLKEELEHKILLLQDELNIENDDILDSDSSDECVYKTNSIPSEKSLKRVSFTEKDHTKYLDDVTPDPPLILNFKHSTNIPELSESNDESRINGPHDIYKVFRNCFSQNNKPYKSILKKTTSSIIKHLDEMQYSEEPGFGDTAKLHIQKQKQNKSSNPVVIGDVFEHKSTSGPNESKVKHIDTTSGPISKFKSKRQSLK